MSEKKARNRNKIQVMAEMLEVCIDATAPTRIASVANVSRRAFRPFLDGLVNRGFLGKIDRAYSQRIVYQTTQKGEDVLEQIYQLRDAFGEELW